MIDWDQNSCPLANRLGAIALGLLVGLGIPGCASWLSHDPVRERLVACQPDIVWEHALTVFNEYPLAVVDKEVGVIETDWREQPVQGQPYGLFGREGLGEKERSQVTLRLSEVRPNLVKIELAERRQHWGFRGGARIYEWYPVPPSPETPARIFSALKKKLEEKGCVFDASLS